VSTAASFGPFSPMADALLDRVRQVVREEIAAAQPVSSVQSPWLVVEGAAEYLGMTPAAVRAAVRRGQLPFEKTPLGQLRFDRSTLDAWVRGEVKS